MLHESAQSSIHASSIGLKAHGDGTLVEMSRRQKNLKLNAAICQAIENKAVIQFEYHGKVRTVEPQSHGISLARNEILRGVQTSPRDSHGKSIEGKLYDVSKMSGLKETGQKFSKPGPHFNPNDKGMIYVHCHL